MTSAVKDELSRLTVTKPCCRKAEMAALLRFAGGLHPGMSSLISIFDFTGDEPSLVYLENDTALQEVNTTDEVDAYGVIFGRIRDAALGAGATTAYLEQLAETLE